MGTSLRIPARPFRRTIRSVLAATLGLVVLAACQRADDSLKSPTGPDISPRAQPVVGLGVVEAVRQGQTRIVVALASTEGARTVTDLRSGVAAAQDAVLRGFLPSELQPALRYAAVPAFVALAMNEKAVRRLAEHPLVRRIDLDVGGGGDLAVSVPQIAADERHALGNTGAGVRVAILDTGADTDHPDLAGRIVHQACFGDADGAINGTGFCPGGSDRATGAGSAEDGAGHGTHVAGIVAAGGVLRTGVAPAAELVAIKVMNNCSFAGCFSYFSEIVAALDYIITNNGTLGIDVVNMSLGTSALFSTACDNSTAYTIAGAAAVNTLRSNGVITFVSSGNNSSGTSMPAPACLTNVIAVAAVNSADAEASFSNVNAITDLWAPGVSISSLSRFGGTTTASGTSMAAPHAAGCAALLIAAGDATTPDAIEARLEDSEVLVTDPTSGITLPRIDCSPDNYPPVADAGGPYSAAANRYFPLAFSATDVDGDALTYRWDFGDGRTGSGPVAPSRARYQAPGTYQIVLIVADARGVADTATATVIVDRAPVAVANGPYTGDEGRSIAFSSAGSTDPDAGALTFFWTFGDGTSSTSASPAKSYRDDGVYSVRLRVTDPNGNVHVATTTATIANVAPTASLVVPEPVYEGGGYVLRLRGGSDAGPADRSSLTYRFDCGDGAGLRPPMTSDRFMCPAAPDQTTRSVSGTISDKDGGSRSYGGTVTIRNRAPAPVITATSPTTIAAGGSFSIAASFTDAGANDGAWRYTILWGNGTSRGSATPGTPITASRSYASPGTYSVRIRVEDKDGGIGYSASITVTVN